MYSLNFWALIFVSLVNFAIGSFVYLGTSRRTDLTFFYALLTTSGSAWAASNAVYSVTSLENLYVVGLFSYFFAATMVTNFSAFSLRYTKMLSLRQTNVLVFLGLIVGALSALPGVVSTGVDESSRNLITSNGIYAYAAFITLAVSLALTALVRSYRKSRGLERERLKTMLMGLLATSVFGLVFNLILPLSGNYSLVAMGPISTIIFIIAFAYSIGHYRLIVFRKFFSRSLVYIFTLALLVATFSGITALLSGAFGFLSDFSYSQRLFLSILVIATGMLYRPLKLFFDKLTKRIFYRDYYDPQLFLDGFNEIVSSRVVTDEIIDVSMDYTRKAFNPDKYSIVLYDDEGRLGKVYGDQILSVSTLDKVFYDSSHKALLFSEDRQINNLKISNESLKDVSLILSIGGGSDRRGLVLMGSKLNGDTYSKKDIKTLEISGDELGLAVQNSIRLEKIRLFNDNLQSEIEAATRKIQKSNEKLKALDVAKDEFISMASHQLRTPLTSVKGYISMVVEGDAGEINPQQKQLLEQAFVSSQRMVYLIADLLNVSRLRTGKFVIDRSPTYLPDVVEGEVSQLMRSAEVRDLKIKFNKPKRFPMANLDETKIRQVVMNFVDNAIYYTPKGGTITVKLKATSTAIEYTVEDTGIGVPKHDVPHLFTKFYRAGNARNARPDGTGLGLFMAKKVVVTQGGSVIFKTKEGKGSTFGFSFPRDKVEIKTGR